MKISLQNIKYPNYNLQKINNQKASEFAMPELSTSSLDTLANYNKANVQFKGAISEIYDHYKLEKNFAKKGIELRYKLTHGKDENGDDLFPRKSYIQTILSNCEPYSVDLIERLCFDDSKDETIFKEEDNLKNAIYCLNENNIDLAERLFFPDEETKEMIKRHNAIDLFSALSGINETNKELAEKLIFGKNEKYQQMIDKYKDVHGNFRFGYLLSWNKDRNKNHFLNKAIDEISPELFPQKEFIHDILLRTNKNNLDLAEKLCIAQKEDGSDLFPYKSEINEVLLYTTPKNKGFIEKLCLSRIILKNEHDEIDFINTVVRNLNDKNVDCIEELYCGTNNNGEPLLNNKKNISNIICLAQNEKEIRKLKSLIELLKERKIPEEIIPFVLKGQITSKDYEKALNILGEERLYDLKGNELYSSIIFADLFQKNDVSELSELSIQDKKQLLKNITIQGSEYFSENDYLVNDFPLIPVDVKSYKKIIQALTSSINIKTEKISQEDENKLNKTLTSLSTTLAKLSDKEFTQLKPLTDNQIKNDLDEIMTIFPELNEITNREQHSTHDFNVFKHSLKVMQKIVQNPSYKKLNDSDKKVLLLASLFHDFSKLEGERDKNHAQNSAFDTFFIMQRLNLSQAELNKLYTIIKHHEWLTNITNPETKDKEKETKSVAYDLHHQNLFELSKIFTEADLKAVKSNNDFYKKKEYPFAGYAYKIDRLIDELKNTQPLLPVTPIPSSTRIKKAIKKVYENGKTNLKGIYQDKNGMVIIRYNEVENKTWEKIGFPKGSISKGIKTHDKEDGKIDTGNIKFFAHGLDVSSDLQNFDVFNLPDSEALLSVSYAERPESKYRFFRTQGAIIKADAQYVHGGGKTDAGSGRKKTIDDFKKDYAYSGSRRYDDRKFVSDLIKKELKLFKGQYRKLVEENTNKPLCEIEPKKYQEKIVKALATINSHTRYGERSYNEMYISNPKVMAVYAYPPHNEVKDTMRFVEKQKDFIKEYAVEKDIPMFIFGD